MEDLTPDPTPWLEGIGHLPIAVAITLLVCALLAFVAWRFSLVWMKKMERGKADAIQNGEDPDRRDGTGGVSHAQILKSLQYNDEKSSERAKDLDRKSSERTGKLHEKLDGIKEDVADNRARITGIGGAHASARLMTNPKFVRWLARATRIPSERLPGHIARLTTIAAREDSETQQAIKAYMEQLAK